MCCNPLEGRAVDKPGETKPTGFSGFAPVDEKSEDLRRTWLPSSAGKPTAAPYARMALNAEYVGVALSDPKYFYWCTSPLEVDGKVHLVAARWTQDMEAWTVCAELVHFVADRPDGPFRYVGKILDNADLKDTRSISPVNPRLEKVDGKFVVFYTAQTKGGTIRGQHIGLIIADTIEGPWRRAGKDGIVLSASDDPTNFSHNSQIGVDNPAFIKIGKRYHLYFKFKDSSPTWGGYGVAVADSLEGPYVIRQRCTDNVSYIEDAQAFALDGRYYLLTDDNLGGNTGIFGAQILWASNDGLTFRRRDAVIATGTIFDYWAGTDEDRRTLMSQRPFVRHPSGKFERPALLMQNGRPTYFYAVGDVNIHGGPTPEVYLLRINDGHGRATQKE